MDNIILRPTCREIAAHDHPEHALHTVAHLLPPEKKSKDIIVECSCDAELRITAETAKHFGFADVAALRVFLLGRLPWNKAKA